MTSPTSQGASLPRVPLLPFQEQIVTDLNGDDHLCLLAAGLGWQKILAVFLQAHHFHQSPGSGALIILGSTTWQRKLLIKELLRHNPSSTLPVDITNEVPATERIEHYRQGKCCFVTTRIFVVDLLSARAKPDAVKGIVVLNAHRVKDVSGEGFAVKIYRAGNKTGFIRAFSDQPTNLSGGFGKVEKLMKALHIRKLSLWPRFQSSVRDDLEKVPIEVVEICQGLTPTMALIQDAITATIGALIKELKRTNKIESSELTLENGMFKSFDELVRIQLNPIWHTVSWKTKQIVQDLQQLRKLSGYLLRYDAVTFLSYLERMRHVGAQSVWLFHDASHTIFEQAKRRVYVLAPDKNPKEISLEKKKKRGSDWRGRSNYRGGGRGGGRNERNAGVTGSESNTSVTPLSVRPILEQQPKWGTLRETLKEIQQERNKLGLETDEGKVLVVCRELYMCSQLMHAIADGGGLMKRMYKGYLAARSEERELREKNERRSRAQRPNDIQAALQEGGAGTNTVEDAALSKAAEHVLEASNSFEPGQPSRKKQKTRGGRGRGRPGQRGRGKHDEPGKEISPQPHELEEIYDIAAEEALPENCPLLSGVQFLALDSHDDFVLWENFPEYVIMYDPDAAFLRQLEVFQAEIPDHPLRLYLVTYENSLEQHKYKSAIQKEIDVFTDVIENKGKITIPIDLDTDSRNESAFRDEATDLQMGVGSTVSRNLITRRAGGRKGQKPKSVKIVVDMREFMSTLPAVLYQKGFVIQPVTLEVGDYVLSPEIVVERKSLPDLFGSFQSGRLYHQAELMSRHYKTPVLLIEFEQDKQFALQSDQDLGQDILPTNIVSKIVLLALHFPKLRIVWSRSLHATAEIFASLKTNQDDPDMLTAAGVGEVPGSSRESVVNQSAVEVLKKLPGVTNANYRLIMNACSSLADLAKMPLPDLEKAMSSKKNAKMLRDFLDAPCPKRML
ncbi:hypothetical protein BSKO_08842 [Bryopsis sp. KO-2023]|nr:hypothetical protein BSKO_08842 [Bryopsis sp. KO-2023]